MGKIRYATKTPDWGVQDWAIMKSDSWNVNFTTSSSGVFKTAVVPDRAEYFERCRYGGNCAYCDARIERGQPIWWLRDELADRSHIWCGNHKPTPKTAPAPAGKDKDNNKEQDMAQRQGFTFPYTGAEIAASLERKAAKLDAQIVTEVTLDRATVALLGYTSDKAYDDLLASKQKDVERANKRFSDDAAELRREAIPYAKAGKQEFQIDLEDIEFFGLNDDEAPAAAAPKRRRRTPSQVAAEKELAKA